MENGRTLIALTGCPNTGKTTIFNGLTGQHKPTGNWSGTTAEPAAGTYMYSGLTYLMTDIPGSDSLNAGREWETLTRDFLRSGLADAVLVVCSAAALERGLAYLDRILRLDRVRRDCIPVVLCLNLWDEAVKQHIDIDLELLSDVLQIPVVPCCARSAEDLDDLKAAIHHACHAKRRRFLCECLDFSPGVVARACCAHCPLPASLPSPSPVGLTAEPACAKAAFIDKLAARPIFGKAVLSLLMVALFWITIAGSAPLSALLQSGLLRIAAPASRLPDFLHLPPWLADCLLRGVCLPLAWAVPLMLPPMAIFFPLLSLLGESGLLPRAAFTMDHCLERCRTCGRQCMSMAVGIGCSAAGVISCRSISAPRERLIAVITNSLIPCSGKFPMLAAMLPFLWIGTQGTGLTAFLVRALILSAAFAAALGASLGLSCLLSHTLLRGSCSSFTLELPPLRRPQFCSVILSSLFNRVLLVFCRMTAVAAPAGLAIWIAARVFTTGAGGGFLTLVPPPGGAGASLLSAFTGLFDPIGRMMGLDGVILAAFLIGLPANEAVLPIIIMIYLQSPAAGPAVPGGLFQLFAANGWTWTTALCLIVFCVFHWPCLTTCRMIRRETRSLPWTAAAVLIPTGLGILCCTALNFLLALPR